MGSQSITFSENFTVPGAPLQTGYDARYVFETQLGASYELPLSYGGIAFLRGGYEGQLWNNFVIPVGSKAAFTDIRLGGIFFSVGIER